MSTKEKWFDVDLCFSVRAHHNGVRIKAKNAEEALKKLEEFMVEDEFDQQAFEAAEGTDFGGGSWDTHDGSGTDYSINDVSLSEDQEDPE